MRAEILTDAIPTADWDAFEIVNHGDDIAVYIKFTDYRSWRIANCDGRKDAESLVKFLTALINTSEQPPAHT